MVNLAKSLVRRLGGRDLLMLAGALIVVLGVWFFIELADRVVAGGTQRLDERVVRSLRRPEDLSQPIGPKWLAEMGRDLTALGGAAVLSLVTASVAVYLLIARQYQALGFVLAATVGGLLLSTLLKDLFARPRPESVPHLAGVYTSSFPSGHSMLSATVYLTLGALLARFVPQRRRKVYFVGIALLLTFLVGSSRVYMGVHYPTDVLAGWTAGLVWSVLCWLVARSFQNRKLLKSQAP